MNKDDRKTLAGSTVGASMRHRSLPVFRLDADEELLNCWLEADNQEKKNEVFSQLAEKRIAEDKAVEAVSKK